MDAMQRACLVAGLLALGPGCAPDLQAGCHGEQTECDGVCVDLTSDALHCGACGHDCLGGACMSGACQPVLVGSGPTRAFGVVVDEATIYWTSLGTMAAGDGDVRRVSLVEGGAATVIASSQLAPRGLAADEKNLYWANSEGDAVMMAPKAGGDPVVIATGQTARDVAVDATHVYWTNTTGQVMKAPIDQSAAATTLFAGAAGPDGIALDATHVYWVNRLDGQVLKAPIENPGGASTVLFAGSISPTDIAVDATHAYWSNFETGEVLRISIQGDDSAPTVIAYGQYDPFGLVVDGAYIYWVSYGSGEVKRAPREGGPEELLASGQVGPRRIVLDEAAIYWTNHDSGELMKLAR